MPAAVSAPFAFIAYPQLVWDPAAARHPRDRDYCWRSHFRDLAATARKAHAEQPLALRIASETERWFVMKLAQTTLSEIEVAIMMIDARQRPNPLGLPTSTGSGTTRSHPREISRLFSDEPLAGTRPLTTASSASWSRTSMTTTSAGSS